MPLRFVATGVAAEHGTFSQHNSMSLPSESASKTSSEVTCQSADTRCTTGHLLDLPICRLCCLLPLQAQEMSHVDARGAETTSHWRPEQQQVQCMYWPLYVQGKKTQNLGQHRNSILPIKTHEI